MPSRKICGMVETELFNEFHNVAADRHGWNKGYLQATLTRAMKLYIEMYKMWDENYDEIESFCKEYYPDLDYDQRHLQLLNDSISDFIKRNKK